jgi:LPS sulfotransferase NodH
MYSNKSGEHEVGYFESLYSAQWDCAPPSAIHLRYLVLAQERTGSELLCAHLRQVGMGVPLEYFHPARLPALAGRLRCVEPGGLRLARYRAELERHRTTENGVFGAKVVMPQLALMADTAGIPVEKFVASFDKVILMRRRDTLRQAISLMRAMSTGQWHVIPGDEQKQLRTADPRLSFARITYCWARILGEERDMARLEATLRPGAARTIWYEELTEPRTMGDVVAWLCAGTPARARLPASDHPLPVKGDSREAEAIVSAYLGYISVEPP